MYKKTFSRDYSIFAIITVIFVMIGVGIFAYISFRNNSIKNSANLRKAAKHIEVIISESFDYTNQLNSQIGQQIARHGAKDLKFILELFRESEKIKHRNSELFSWSAFDWVDADNRQTVNSRLGIRKNPPNMSLRQYAKSSSLHPWALQTSFPTYGDPSNDWVIPAATGIMDKNGKYLGAIVVGFDIAQFSGQIVQKLNEKISFIVLDKDLRILMQSIDVDLAKDSDFFQKNFDTKIFTAHQGDLNQIIKVGDISFSQYSKIPKYNYTVLVGFDKKFFNHQFSILVFPRILEFFCIVVFFLIILYLFETRIFSLLNLESKLRQSLEKTNIAKDKILFSIAHDIKNQVFGIYGLARTILDEKTKKEVSTNEDLQMVETISDQSEELMDFVKDLLDSNQVESGEFTLGKVKAHHIESLIMEVVLMNGGFAASNQVKLKTKIADNLPKFFCDARRIKQILANLINNAIKYSHAEDEVIISAKLLKEDQVQIEIIDSGYGMSEEEIEKYLSNRGSEIDKSHIAKDKKIESHGIGMLIVSKLVALHQGKISVESKKNLGTKVILNFGLNKLREKFIEKAESAPIKSIGSKGKTILLVEDNPVNIKITKRLLENSGYKILHAENGREALEIIDKENFDLILMDGEMPVMKGYEATRKIREGKVFKNFKNYKTIPIVAFMSCYDEKTVKKAIDSGMNDYIEKTSSKTKLFEMVEKYCG